MLRTLLNTDDPRIIFAPPRGKERSILSGYLGQFGSGIPTLVCELFNCMEMLDISIYLLFFLFYFRSGFAYLKLKTILVVVFH